MALPPPLPLPASPDTLSHAIPLAPSTPAPHRARLTSLESQIAQLIAQRQSAERRHRAEVAELKGVLAEARGKAEEGEGEVGRCRREGEHMRNELLSDHALYAQRAHLALLAEQLAAEALREDVRTLQIHSVMRNHKLVRFKHREARADRQFDALEERERAATAKLARLRSSDSSSLARQTEDLAAREAESAALLLAARKTTARLQAAVVEKEADVARQVAETQRVEAAYRARERELEREKGREREARREAEEREAEVERQVDETKRVEEALRAREREIRELKKQLAAAPPPTAKAKPKARAPEPVSDDDDSDADDVPAPAPAPKQKAKPVKSKPAPAPRAPSPPSSPSSAPKPKKTKPAPPPPPPVAGPSSDGAVGSPVSEPKKTKLGKKEKSKAAKAAAAAAAAVAGSSSPAPAPPPKPKKTLGGAAAAKPAKRKESPTAGADDDDDEAGAAGGEVKEKKKKRKLGGGMLKSGKRFDWDVVQGPDGIPTVLSPVKLSAKSALSKGKSLAGRW